MKQVPWTTRNSAILELVCVYKEIKYKNRKNKVRVRECVSGLIFSGCSHGLRWLSCPLASFSCYELLSSYAYVWQCYGWLELPLAWVFGVFIHLKLEFFSCILGEKMSLTSHDSSWLICNAMIVV